MDEPSATPPTPLDAGQSGRLERLLRATPMLVAEHNHERVLEQVAELSRELLAAKYVAVGLLGADGTTLTSFVTAGLTPEDRQRIGALPRGRGILGLVIKEGKVVRLRDLGAHPAACGFPPHHPRMHSFLGVPIIGRQGVLGDLYLTEKIGAEEFSDEDVHIALLLASIVGSAVENARFHERTSRLLEEVQELHRSRERFFAMVNHELRNALAGVYGWAEMLVRKKDPATVPRGAYEVMEGAEQAVALINDLLDLNRLDEDRLRPVLRDVDCRRLVRASLQRVTPIAAEKGVRLVEPPESLAVVCRTDVHRFEQIMVNLLTNAIRHTPRESMVDVQIESADSQVRFRVLDQGPGVAADQADRIFDIYYSTAMRADGGGAGGAGHGVGLALSRRLARLLGGDLVALPATGRGEFLLTIPAAGAV
jgi:signal transduction histidine kinase